MAVTSLLKPVQDKKGIFYNFQSALEDINITLSNSENAVRFSKFALLRLPEIGTPDFLATDNKIQFLAQGETPLIEGVSSNNNLNLTQSFQNYALNLESLLLSMPGYKRNEKLTVSERVFWKWLKELGAIRFQDANSLEKNITVLGNDPRFVEKPETNSTYNKVVKYIGDIDVVNSIKSSDNSYTEVYIHVPTNVGTTPHVLFKSVEDPNYKSNMTIANTYSNPLDIEYLAGRHYNETHPFGLSLKAFYDLDDNSILSEVKDNITDTYSIGSWTNSTITNSYYTEPSAYFNTSAEQYIKKTEGLTSVEYARTRLDGISLDFDLANYKLASENKEIKVFSQFNDYVANRNFEFNAILVYYDTFDPNSLDANGNPTDSRTNLYGILFLDSVQQNGLEFQIPTIAKYKPDPLNKTNGNSFSFKMNLKLDSSIEDVKVEKSINDFSTFSMDLFTDVLTQFKQLQTRYTDKLLELESLKQEVDGLKGTLLNTAEYADLDSRLTVMETSLQANSAIFDNTNGLINMITNLNSKVDSIINGQSNIQLSYNLDAVRPGLGIEVNRSTPNRVKISSTSQAYNISSSSVRNITANRTIKLNEFTNYVVHDLLGSATVLDRDIVIQLDDSENKWKLGQTMRIVIHDPVILGLYTIQILTDKAGVANLGQYGVLITILDNTVFEPTNTPIFDIICIDPVNYKFRIDKIR
jgi:hypothetical protein